ncbi:XrtN system VIT domain-containing protein [Tellurirhabdus bombi]|uniref:XrtN system VIT domain-containing protein n=1 Tax=Tellurirhabdus bombi TaxID=2907205 RepID=UPI001F36C4BA|nr:XrtN system VIT domain-containing protein [Tellurirhabdus bombi]
MDNFLTNLTSSSASTSPKGSVPPAAGLFQLTDQTPSWLRPFKEPLFRTGFFLVVIMALIHGAYTYYALQTASSLHMEIFFLHYAAAAFYGLSLLSKGYLVGKRRQEGRPLRLLLWVLFLMSCFALNREMHIFQEAVTWFSIALVLASALFIASTWIDYFSVRGQQVVLFGLAAAWWLFAYQAIYLTTTYMVGILGSLLLGVSIHAYIPLFITIDLFSFLRKGWRENEHYRPALLLGSLLPLLLTGYFLVRWHQVNTKIKFTLNEIQARRDDELPAWALLGQQLQPDWVTERLLKTGSFYDQANPRLSWDVFSRGLEVKQHDPFVIIASRFIPPTTLSGTETTKLLNILYDARHQLEERLWSGQTLQTSNVLSQVRIYPEYRLAYTEKTIQIQNNEQSQWRSPQEAIYTFYLPAGSVVTSLSLWVNGREERGALTTQAKADTAYHTIVGVESRQVVRDPSLVRWQEGNRITVRVFPCPPRGMRQFKIGITSPLTYQSDRLIYENPLFDGPNGTDATETVRLDFTQQPTDLLLPKFLQPSLFDDQPRTNQYTKHTDYQPYWEISMAAPPLKTAGFTFANSTYQIEPIQYQNEAFDPKALYLDINESWTADEIKKVLQGANNRPVWVYDEGLRLLTAENQEALIEQLRKQRFSLFPVYQIPAPEESVLLTKASQPGPQLDDLATSSFADQLGKSAADRAPLRTFCLSAEPSALVKTLSELHVLRTEYGSVNQLVDQLKIKRFSPNRNTDNTIYLEKSGVLIRRKTASAASSQQASVAPDHLLRLFAYNHLLHQIGRQYFNRSFLTPPLIAEAQQANVVSPLSSLVVLETQKDYDRFGIKRQPDGLGNATLKNEGAVPEPHEWALLVVAALWVLYTIRQKAARRTHASN